MVIEWDLTRTQLTVQTVQIPGWVSDSMGKQGYYDNSIVEAQIKGAIVFFCYFCF